MEATVPTDVEWIAIHAGAGDRASFPRVAGEEAPLTLDVAQHQDRQQDHSFYK